ncbi:MULTISPECIES: hypothetical protein [unclassified Pseudomonas]|uniref:hypothetical protein n=1 Tax=unclassified Pseudomonas TaxID=196821 RepID=UPI00161BBB86|nr:MULTISPECIES: hypothetical protein [unclassified Pseudomonas]MBB6288940.1 hypothetical protein [Pseudomonas sp. SJZ073]MBB6313912.1 hypothetical protein [Pseudomonas sp. JAI120]
MSNGKITQIYEAFVEDDVNRYLADGWMIVAVVSGTRIYNGKEEIGPVYVLGLPDSEIEPAAAPLGLLAPSRVKMKK